MAADQQAARAAYPGSAKRDSPDSGSSSNSLRLPSGEQTPVRLGRFRATSLRGLFHLIRGDPVPLRDLADHAPINYVSALAGRAEATG